MTHEPLLDLDRLVAGIWWRRRIWMSLALLGVLVGVLLTVAAPPRPTAVARVLVARADDQVADRKTLMETDVAVFETTQVAGAALKELGIDGRPADFLATYRVEGITPNVLEITVDAPSDDDAVRRAQALADKFIAGHVGRAREAADGQANALLALRAQLEKTVEEVSNAISTTIAQGDAAPPQSRQAADVSAQLDALYARRAGLAAQILELGKRADDARLTIGTVAVGTRIVDPPQARTTSLTRTGIMNAVVGLVLGLGAGLALSAVLSVTRDRPVLRRDIATQLGVSVVVQLPATRRSALGRWRWGLQARERRRAAASLARLIQRSPRSASLLEIGCPRTVAALALDIAEQVAVQRPVILVDDLRRKYLRRGVENDQVAIVDRGDLPLEWISPSPEPRLYLRVGSVGPGTAWGDLGEFGPDALLVIHAGRATASWLRVVALQLAHAGIVPIGVVLVAPHPRDHSDGTLWDALHATIETIGQRNGAAPHELSRSILPH